MEIGGVAAVVTGGTSGLGEATALAALGAKVAIFDMNEAAAEAVAKDIAAPTRASTS